MKFNLQWAETNHRVREITMGDGSSTFYPQRKLFFLVWRTFIDPDWSTPTYRNYSTLEQANEFLMDRQLEVKRNKVVKKTNHEFNLVFEKLKQ